MLGKLSSVADGTILANEVCRMLKDDRVKQTHTRSIFAEDDFSDILG